MDAHQTRSVDIHAGAAECLGSAVPWLNVQVLVSPSSCHCLIHYPTAAGTVFSIVLCCSRPTRAEGGPDGRSSSTVAGMASRTGLTTSLTNANSSMAMGSMVGGRPHTPNLSTMNLPCTATSAAIGLTPGNGGIATQLSRVASRMQLGPSPGEAHRQLSSSAMQFALLPGCCNLGQSPACVAVRGCLPCVSSADLGKARPSKGGLCAVLVQARVGCCSCCLYRQHDWDPISVAARHTWAA